MRVIFLILAFAGSVNAQLADFYKEKIIMSLSEKSVEITGYYHFRNPTSEKYSQALYYPFVINEYTDYPDSIYAVDQIKNSSIIYKEVRNGIIFNLTIDQQDTAVYKVGYKQKIDSNKAEYILTTTKYWKKPFNYAEYYLVLPTKFKNIDFSIPFKEDSINANYKYFSFRKENYFPSQNLFITWRQINEKD